MIRDNHPKSDNVPERYRSPRSYGRKPRGQRSCTSSETGSRTPGTPSSRALGLRYAKAHVKTCFCDKCRVPTDLVRHLVKVKNNAPLSIKSLLFIVLNPKLYFEFVKEMYLNTVLKILVFLWDWVYWIYFIIPIFLMSSSIFSGYGYICSKSDPHFLVEESSGCFYIDFAGLGPHRLFDFVWGSYNFLVTIQIVTLFNVIPTYVVIFKAIRAANVFTLVSAILIVFIIEPIMARATMFLSDIASYLAAPPQVFIYGIGIHLYCIQIFIAVISKVRNNVFWLKYYISHSGSNIMFNEVEQKIWVRYGIFMGYVEIIDEHTLLIGIDEEKDMISLMPPQAEGISSPPESSDNDTFSRSIVREISTRIPAFIGQRRDKEYIRDLMYDLSKATCFITNSKGNILVVVAALLNFADNRYNTRLVFNPDFRDSFEKALMSIVKKAGPDDSTMEEQNLNVVETVADYGQLLVERYNEFVESAIYKKVYNLFCYTLAFGIFKDFGVSFDTFGYNKLQAELVRKKYYKRTTFVVSLVDTCSFLAKQGIQYMKTGMFSHIFHSGTTYAQWFDECSVLKNQTQFLDDPQAAGFSLFEYEGNLDSALEKGEAIVEYGVRYASKVEAALLKRHFTEIKMLKANLATTKRANQTRKPPLGVMLHGDSGIGKSYLKDLLFYYYCDLRGLPNGDEYKYTRSPVSEFWDGFRSSVHTLVMDDVAYLKPGATSAVDLSLNEIIQVMNPTPMMPNQASLEKKGRTPFLGELLIATTNIKDLNAYDYFAHPSAVQRRLPFIITPTVRKEYQKAGGALNTKLVSSEQFKNSNAVEDYWVFKVEEVESQRYRKNGDNLAKYKVIHEELSTFEFLAWFGSVVSEHHDQQNIMKESVEKLKKLSVCKLCYNLSDRCDCEKQSMRVVQAFVTAKTTLPIIFLTFIRIVQLHEFITNILWLASFLLLFVPLDQKVVWWGAKHWLRIKFLRSLESTRETFQQIGNNINEKFGYPRRLLAMAASVAALGAIYKLWNSHLPKQSERVPTPDKEQKNPWKKCDYQTTPFDVPRVSISWKQLSREQVIEKLRHNVCRVNIKDQGGESRTSMLGVCGHWYIINDHAVPSVGDLMIEIIRGSQMDGVNPSTKIVRRQSDIIRIRDTDCALLYIRELPPIRNIRNLIASPTLSGTMNGYYIVRDASGNITVKEVTNVTRSGYLYWRQNLGVFWNGRAEIENTVRGDCGSPLILETELGPVIAGIHCAGDGPRTQAFTIPDRVFAQIDRADTNIDSNEPNISAPGFERSVVDLHYKSPIRYLEEGSATVYGSFTGFRAQPKSRVEETPMNSYLSSQGYRTKYTKPTMSGWTPKRIALADLVTPVYKFDQSVIDEVKMAFLNDIIRDLPESEIKLLTPYDTYTAINGAKDVSYVDRINISTSAGNPYRKVKKFFLDADPSEDLPEGVKFLDPINNRIGEMISTYKKKCRVQPNFCAHLKDEPVTFAKAEKGKTRVFTGAPIDWTIVVRKYLLSFVRVSMRNRFAFECSVGLVVQSKQWGELYHHLTAFGTETVVAGDYKSFDKKMSPVFTMAAFDIIIELCKLSGNYDQDEIDILAGIAADTCYPLVDYFGDLIQLYGSNPSGNPITVQLNCLVNSLYIRYVYHILNPKREAYSFRQNVRATTYGDDLLMTVNSTAPWYNHTSIAQVFADMGITFTMADKEAESVPYISMAFATFLKRTFRFDHDVGDWLAPLDHESIEKSLMVWVKSKSICKEQQCIAIISSAVREYFFYGKSVYNKRVEMFQRLIQHLQLESFVQDSTLPTYESLLEDFHGSGISGQILDEPTAQPGDPGYLGSLYVGPKASSLGEENSYIPRPGKGGLGSLPLVKIPAEQENKIKEINEGECSGKCSRAELEDIKDLLRSFEEVSSSESTSDGSETNDELPPQSDRVESTDEQLLEDTGTTHQTLAYSDDHNTIYTNPPARWDSTFDDIMTPSVELKEFLSRPVLIASYVWSEGSTLAESTLLPWFEFFNTPAISRKLSDFAYLRCNLKVKVVVNASPFYYGYAIMTYRPYVNGPFAAGENPANLTDIGSFMITSQRRRIDILPGKNLAGEMMLPFISKQNYIQVNAADNFNEMGVLSISSCDILRNANGVAGTGVDIQVFAWAEDVVLNVPTSTLVAQSDEYETNGPISSVASNVAAASSGLMSFLPPPYQPFAMATSIGAGAIAKIASLFGYSNTPVVDDVAPYKNLPFHAMASAEISCPFEKLTVDPKNELTIDPAVAGGSEDELSINYLVGKSSVVYCVNWDTTDVPGTLIKFWPVTPCVHMDQVGNNYDFATSFESRFFMTPMSLVARHFRYWRGTLCYRIKFVCTQFHRGRVAIYWDPYTNNSQPVSSQTNFTRIVDLSNDSEIVIKVPYLQPASFLKTAWNEGDATFPTINNSIPDVPLDDEANGSVSIRVLNRLTAPVSSSSVPIFVEMWMEDAVFASPTDLQSIGSYLSYLPPQSDRVIKTEEKHDIPENYVSQMIPRTPSDLTKVYMGEAIMSMRSLMRRRAYYRTITFPSDATNVNAIGTLRLGRRPQFFGFDANGNHTANQLIGILTSPFNFVHEPLCNTFSPCFVGERGSYNFEINLNNTGISVDTLGVYRRVQGWNTATFDDTLSSAQSTPAQRARLHMLGTQFLAKSGGALTNTKTQTGLQVQIPMYSRFRFMGTNPVTRNNGSTIDESDSDGIGVCFKLQPVKGGEHNPDRIYLDFYCGIGTDYQLVHFVNVPVAYVYPSLPGAI